MATKKKAPAKKKPAARKAPAKKKPAKGGIVQRAKKVIRRVGRKITG